MEQTSDCGSVLIVTGGPLQVPAVEAARKLGLRVIVTDRDPHCACAELADVFYALDIYDVAGHRRLVRELQSDGVPLRGVFTAAADPVATVAYAADEVSLHGVPISVAEMLVAKFRVRTYLQYAEVPQPRFYFCYCPDEMREAVAELGGTAIIKATGAAGGRGHTKVHCIEQATNQVFETALAYATYGCLVLAEELLDGLELSAEALWWNGTMTPLNAVERPFAHRSGDAFRYSGLAFPVGAMPTEAWQRAIERGSKVAIELGHYNPALLAPATWDEVWQVVEQTGTAIGLGDASGGHIHKCDLILTDDGVKVLETTVRLSGNWDSGRTSPLAHGVDYTLGALKLALGGEPDWTLFAPRWHRHAVCLFYFAPHGRVTYVQMPPPGVAEVILRRRVGDVVGPLDSYAALAAWVVADGETREMALGRAYRALCDLEMETANGSD